MHSSAIEFDDAGLPADEDARDALLYYSLNTLLHEGANRLWEDGGFIAGLLRPVHAELWRSIHMSPEMSDSAEGPNYALALMAQGIGGHPAALLVGNRLPEQCAVIIVGVHVAISGPTTPEPQEARLVVAMAADGKLRAVVRFKDPSFDLQEPGTSHEDLVDPELEAALQEYVQAQVTPKISPLQLAHRLAAVQLAADLVPETLLGAAVEGELDEFLLLTAQASGHRSAQLLFDGMSDEGQQMALEVLEASLVDVRDRRNLLAADVSMMSAATWSEHFEVEPLLLSMTSLHPLGHSEWWSPTVLASLVDKTIPDTDWVFQMLEQVLAEKVFDINRSGVHDHLLLQSMATLPTPATPSPSEADDFNTLVVAQTVSQQWAQAVVNRLATHLEDVMTD